MSTPILIKAGDTRLLINGQPPLVDCRVVAEEYYESIIKKADSLAKASTTVLCMNGEVIEKWQALQVAIEEWQIFRHP